VALRQSTEAQVNFRKRLRWSGVIVSRAKRFDGIVLV
jgi:hypothetical protein